MQQNKNNNNNKQNKQTYPHKFPFDVTYGENLV